MTKKIYLDYQATTPVDSTVLEKKPLETLAQEQKLTAFKHNGFWHPMDTLRDKNYLENFIINSENQFSFKPDDYYNRVTSDLRNFFKS